MPASDRDRSYLLSRSGEGSVGAWCCLCGRVLRSEASRARGVGPHCFRASGGRVALRLPAPHVDLPIPGQTEIPMPPMQHTLTWSSRCLMSRPRSTGFCLSAPVCSPRRWPCCPPRGVCPASTPRSSRTPGGSRAPSTRTSTAWSAKSSSRPVSRCTACP
ncbi:DUF6011 domain-containing protein [Streptomyces sp. NPDC088258]|uniref:DUF6011 domain-containing protein n=1 Tax=Streptomyces sp. NPDC088258 TaxID=3365849 RepID=UPI003815D514